MSEQNREQISALMDDELEHGSLNILNVMKDNHELKSTWQRYHLIGESLRGNLPAYIDMNLATRISSAIRNEPTILAPAASSSQLLKPVIGFAIAASVTVVAILGIRQAGIGPAGSPAPAVATTQPATTSYVASVAAKPVTPVILQSDRPPVDAESRLNRYLVNHNEYRSSTGVQGMLPYVRIVAHEVEE